MRGVVGSLLVEVIKGDITEVAADAIVNPANSLMVMGGGVARAIRMKGGIIIEEEALRYAPVPVGEAVATTAGRLPAKYVIHAPTMPRPAMRIPPENAYKATKAALEKADELGVEIIAFPGMGTGVGGLDYYVAAKEMLKAIKEHAPRNLKKVLLVAYSEEAYQKFIKALAEEASESGAGTP